MADVVLITGGSGFLGFHLSNRLTEEGWEVHITSRSAIDDDDTEARRHVCDFSDVKVAEQLLKQIRPSVIFHLAGAVSAQPDIDLVIPTFLSHVVSSVNLMTLMSEVPVRRLVLSGSMNEGLNDTPSSPYSAAKSAVRIYAKMFHKLYSTRLVFVRPFVTFGPHQKKTKVLPYVIRTLAAGKVPRIGSGTWRADWIYVSDVIDGFVRAGTVPGIEGAEFEFGRGELSTLQSMVMRIAELMHSPIVPEFGARADRPDEPERKADIANSCSQLGWQPMVSIDEGLTRTIKSYP